MEIPQPASASLPPVEIRFPLVASAILVVLCAIFAAEYKLGGSWDISVPTLHEMGGLSQNAVFQAGEWYRLFSAPLLHGNLIHLLANGVSLVFAGMMLEHIIGRAWFAAAYAISGFTGAVLSLLMIQPTVVSIGASGAITGLFATICLVSFLYPADDRQKLQTYSLRVLVPAIIPALGASSGNIDYGAHIGGAIGGGAVGYLVLGNWPQVLTSRLATAAKAISVVGILLAANAAFPALQSYQLRSELIPSDQYPKNSAEGRQQSEQLVTNYPNDPRSHFYRVLFYLEQNDVVSAETELRTVLENKNTPRFFSRNLEPASKAMLKFILYGRGQDFQKQGLVDQALAAFDEVISIDMSMTPLDTSQPQNHKMQAELDKLKPHYQRGIVHLLKLDNERALQDFDEELRHHPNDHDTYWARGRARYHRGEYTMAARDFKKSLEADPRTERNYISYALWLYLAQAQLNEPAKAELASTAAKLPSKKWPYPVVDFYLGYSTAATLLAETKLSSETCEADFYLAESHLLRGAKEAAIPLLQSNTVFPCAKTFHGNAAALELRKLGL
jgi:rhomboid protease GluP